MKEDWSDLEWFIPSNYMGNNLYTLPKMIPASKDEIESLNKGEFTELKKED